MPYTYFPDPSGGTEVYVRALAQRLGVRGFSSAVAAPGAEFARYIHDNVAVHRFATDKRRRLALAYGAPDEIAAKGFEAIVAEVKPRIVHLHAHTPAVSERLVDVAHAAGARVVFTFHTPTASCARGTMMLFGKTPCDGLIERRRCTACALAAVGAPRPLAALASRVPRALAGGLAEMPFEMAPLSTIRIPGLIAERCERFARLTSKVDHLVAVCTWVAQVLERNGVPGAKITLSRQGVAEASDLPSPPPPRPAGSPLRIAFFGRLDRTKGIDLLAGALRHSPDARVSVEIYTITDERSKDELALLQREALRDARLQIRSPVAPGDVLGIMSSYDLIAVPSRWLETGPLVVLEAFGAGVPVLGSNIGGIAELVRDGIDGVLLAPDDTEAWASGISRLAGQPDLVAELRSNVRSPRTMADAADDMAALYSNLIDRPRQPAARVS